jgi:hypothetical protein
MDWLAQAEQRLATCDDVSGTLAILSARAARKIGPGTLDATAAAIPTPLGDVSIDGWSLADVARTCLLCKALEREPSRLRPLVEALFRNGDEVERAVIAKAAALLDPHTELKPLILEAGRANSQQLIRAVALRNPYPAAHYTDPEFNQMILKALFLGLPIQDVVGLRARANAELSRMCEDYCDERIAAERSVPANIWLALGPYASAHGEALLHEYAHHQDREHRHFAGQALDERSRPRLSA